jgi:DNA repair exonuclease SbcCD ATPase subunit
MSSYTIDNKCNDLSEYLRELFNSTAMGVGYWRKHRHHKCYKCGKYGHIAADCNKVCPLCDNIHTNTLCVHSLIKLYEKIVEILKRNVLPDQEKLCKKIEAAKYRISRECIDQTIKNCEVHLQNRNLEITSNTQFLIDRAYPFARSYDYTKLKISHSQWSETAKCHSTGHSDNSFVQITQGNHMTFAFNNSVFKTIAINKTNKKITCISNTINRYSKLKDELSNQLQILSQNILVLRSERTTYEVDKFRIASKMPTNKKYGWFESPEKFITQIDDKIKELDRVYKMKKNDITNIEETIHKYNDNLSIEQNKLKQIMKQHTFLNQQIRQKTKGVLSISHNTIALKTDNPYRIKKQGVEKLQKDCQYYIEKLNKTLTMVEEFKINMAKLKKVNKNLTKETEKLENVKLHKREILDNIISKADSKIKKKIEKFDAKKNKFYEKKEIHYIKLNNNFRKNQLKLKKMGDLLRGKKAQKKRVRFDLQYSNGSVKPDLDYRLEKFEELQKKLAGQANPPKIINVKYH